MTYNELGNTNKDVQVLWGELCNVNKQALAELFDCFFDSMYAYGYRIVGREGEIKDAIQEVFFQLWKYRESLNEVYSVRSYLFVSLRRQLLKDKSAKSRQEDINKKYISEQFEPRFNQAKWRQILDLDESKSSDLKKAMGELTPRQKEVIYLKYYEGLTSDELSEVMGLRTQSVYNLVFDAIKCLQSHLDT